MSAKQLRFWIGMAVGLVCLVLALRGIDLGATGRAVASADYRWLLAAWLSIPFALLTRTWRWRVALHPGSHLRNGKLLSVLTISYLLNSVLPARLGDVIRAVLIADIESLTPGRALASIVLEKMWDVLMVLALLLLLVPLMPVPSWALQLGAGAALIFGVAALLALVISYQHRRVQDLARRVAAMLPLIAEESAGRNADAVVQGFRLLRNVRVGLSLAVWSVVVWAVTYLYYYLVLLAFGINIPIVGSLFLLGALSLSMMVPSAPAYLGVYHYVVVLALGVFGVERSTALSYALVSHAMTYGSLVVLGTLALWKESLSYAQLKRRVEVSGAPSA